MFKHLFYKDKFYELVVFFRLTKGKMLVRSLIQKNNFINKLIDSFLGKGLHVLFTLVFSFLATRLYGVEVFGEYTFAFTIVSILMILAKAGLDNGLIYFIPSVKNKYISLSLITNLVISIVIILISFLLVNDKFLRFMLPLIWLLSVEQIFFAIYRSEGKIREFYFVNAFISMLIRIVLVIFLFYFWDSSAFVLGFSVYFSLLISNLLYFYRNKKKITKIYYNSSFLLYSFPLVLANLLGILMGKIDVVMLGILSTNENVGIYQVVVQITNSISLLIVVFSTVFAPKISELYHQNKIDSIKKLYNKATKFLSLIGLILTIFLILTSNFILDIFGDKVVTGKLALIYLSLGQFVNVAVGNVWTMMAMTGKPKLQFYANLLAFTSNIILNILLIPKYGISGAAFATMITHFITNSIGYYAVSKRFSIKAFKWF